MDHAYQEKCTAGVYYEAYLHRKIEKSMAPHYHEPFELCYVIKGKREFMVNGIVGQIAAGEFLMILPNQIHAFENNDVYNEFWVCKFTADYVPGFASRMAGMQGTKAVFTCGASIMECCRQNLFFNERLTLTQWQEFAEPPFTAFSPQERPPHLLTAQGCLHLICACYMKQAPLEPREEKKEAKARQLISYVSENFRDNITLLGAAEALGYSKNYLSRCFHQNYEMHFKQFVNQYRLNYARKLIHEDKMGIEKAALESGFGTARNFYRVHKSMTGKTPREMDSRGTGVE